MRKFIDTSRKLLSGHPLLKRVAKTAFHGIILYADSRAIQKYHKWYQAHIPTDTQLDRQRTLSKEFAYQPLISIIVPTYNPPISYFEEMITSVYSQTYQNWELVIVDDASPNDEVRRLIEHHAKHESRITYEFLKTNHRIAGATNRGIKLAHGTFIGLLDNDDVLCPDALFEVVSLLNEDKALNLIYSDEDKFTDLHKPHLAPYFKPGWNPDFLRSVNYITHFAVLRKSIVDKLGGEDGEYDGAQDWELFLRVSRNIAVDTIAHVPKILYNWRVHDLSTAKNIESKPYVVEAQRKVLEEDLRVRGVKNATVEQDPLYLAQWVTRYNPQKKSTVTFVTQDDRAAHQLEALLRRSGVSVKTQVLAWREGLDMQDLRGEFISFVYEVPLMISDNLIRMTIGDAGRQEIGFVMARYSDDGDIMSNIQRMINPRAARLVDDSSMRDVTKHFYSTVRYNIPEVEEKGVVTIEKRKLAEVRSGVSPNISVYSKKLHQLGYRSLYNPYVEMLK